MQHLNHIILLYPREKGPMGGAPYIRPGLGKGGGADIHNIIVMVKPERAPR